METSESRETVKDWIPAWFRMTPVINSKKGDGAVSAETVN